VTPVWAAQTRSARPGAQRRWPRVALERCLVRHTVPSRDPCAGVSVPLWVLDTTAATARIEVARGRPLQLVQRGDEEVTARSSS